MTLIYQETRVQAPSAAPTSSGSSGSIQVAHRRVNQNGEVSKFSPILEDIALPATITPQSYADTANLLRDEFVVSNDSGTTWRVVPRATNGTGAFLVPAYSSSWALTTDTDTQITTATSINLGTFTGSSSGVVDIFVTNLGANLSTLTAHINDQLNQIATNYSGLVSIELLGYLAESGTGNLVTTNNKSIIWVAPSRGFNVFNLPLLTNSFAKFRISLVNVTSNGNIDPTIELDLSFTANQRIYPIAYDARWLNLSLLYDPSMGFSSTLVSSTVSGVLTLQPFALNYNGRAVVNPAPFDQSITGNVKVLVGSQGQLAVVSAATTVPSNYITLLTCTLTGTSVTNLVVLYPFNAPYNSVGAANLGRFQLVQLDSSGTLELCDNLDKLIGISAFDGSNGVYLSGRLGWVKVASTVDIGDLLTLSSTAGSARAVSGSESVIGVALTAASSGGYVLADFSLIKINTSGVVVSEFALMERGDDPSTSSGETIVYADTSNNLKYREESDGAIRTVATLSKTQTYTKAQSVTPITLTDGATITPDFAESNVFKVVLGGNRTLAAPTNTVDGQTVNLLIKQDGTGSRTLTWNSVYTFPGGTDPTLSTGANDIDLVSCLVDGSSLRCVFVGDFS